MPLYASSLVDDPLGGETPAGYLAKLHAAEATAAAAAATAAAAPSAATGNETAAATAAAAQCVFDVVILIDRYEDTSLRTANGTYILDESYQLTQGEAGASELNLNRVLSEGKDADSGNDNVNAGPEHGLVGGKSGVGAQIRNCDRLDDEGYARKSSDNNRSVCKASSLDEEAADHIDEVIEAKHWTEGENEFHLESKPMPFGSLSPFPKMNKVKPSDKEWDRHVHARLDESHSGNNIHVCVCHSFSDDRGERRRRHVCRCCCCCRFCCCCCCFYSHDAT